MALTLHRIVHRPWYCALLLVFALQSACKDEPANKPSPNLQGRPIIESGKRPNTSSSQSDSPIATQTTTSPARDTKQSETSPVKSPGLYPLVTFDVLASFKYQKPPLGADPKAPRPDQFPPKIKQLNETKVTVIGYMAPLSLDDDGRVIDFMLIRNQLFCCYGKPLELNEWIEVTMADGKPIKEMKDIPLAASGTLSVGEKDIEGLILNLYRLKLEDIRPVDPNAKPNPLPLPR